jgi:hypothetical protein
VKTLSSLISSDSREFCEEVQTRCLELIRENRELTLRFSYS